MSYIKFVLLLQLFVFGYAVKNNCTANAIGKAQQDFNQKLKLNSGLTWATPISLGIAIQNIFINGSDQGDAPNNGLVAVCNAYNTFLGSLSAQNVSYTDCLNPRFIIANDASPIIGYAYAGLMKMIGYQCGAGLFPAMASWECIQHTYSQRNTTLLGCLNALHLDAESNYTAACTYTKTAMTCWQQAFLQTCGNDNQVAYYACQTIRAYTSAAYGECDDRCMIFGRAQYAIDTQHEKLEELNESMKKIPSPDKILLEQVKAKWLRT